MNYMAGLGPRAGALRNAGLMRFLTGWSSTFGLYNGRRNMQAPDVAAVVRRLSSSAPGLDHMEHFHPLPSTPLAEHAAAGAAMVGGALAALGRLALSSNPHVGLGNFLLGGEARSAAGGAARRPRRRSQIPSHAQHRRDGLPPRLARGALCLLLQPVLTASFALPHPSLQSVWAIREGRLSPVRSYLRCG